MDNDSGDDETDELRELGWEEWEKDWSGLGCKWPFDIFLVLINKMKQSESQLFFANLPKCNFITCHPIQYS